MKDKIVLKNHKEFEMEPGSSIFDVKIELENKPDIIDIWQELNPENLSLVEIRNGSDEVCGVYADVVLSKITIVEKNDKTIMASFGFREKTELEKRINILDGAVGDLGAVASALAEQVGGEA